ncbi:FGGY-family carbohydrate kinase [Cryptosporangium phraense]|uniref:Carbohydrate kinase n=1 Tax=Cryptosporangium phraense TaxID=2593070 RepID=A0A545AUJ7_9ACTN|nr:FGGY-family carbohydrate kinase [Cryptosporangium phraense]TQS45006.1 carbohydrate kinase [Cryptosporangium phraense]
MTSPAGGYLLGIDAGQTVIKAALFDTSGHEVVVAQATTTVSSPHPHWQERDMDAAWGAAADAVHRALESSGVDPTAVLAVGLAGHNDGLHLVDPAGRPVRPAILATDSRAVAEAAALQRPGALELTGSVPLAYSPASILAWLSVHEPSSLEKAAAMLYCKDWLLLNLTGEVVTDPTDASAFATDLWTQEWSTAVLELYGLEDLARLLPPMRRSSAVVGSVTTAAAALTGLRPGTPVVTGCHDVDANALGIGAIGTGALSLVLGTFSINQVVGNAPVVDPRWQARTFFPDGASPRWLHMSTSPSGASNLEWAVRQFGGSSYQSVISSAADRDGALAPGPDDPLYLPFLYGGPVPSSGGGLVGLRGWHTAADVHRAVLEGIVFNHRWHVEALGSSFPLVGAARLCGGGARSAVWSQLLADALGLPVEVTDAAEAGARGAAMLAGAGVGAYAGLGAAVKECVRVVRRHEPERNLDARYGRYLAAASALATLRP